MVPALCATVGTVQLATAQYCPSGLTASAEKGPQPSSSSSSAPSPVPAASPAPLSALARPRTSDAKGKACSRAAASPRADDARGRLNTCTVPATVAPSSRREPSKQSRWHGAIAAPGSATFATVTVASRPSLPCVSLKSRRPSESLAARNRPSGDSALHTRLDASLSLSCSRSTWPESPSPSAG